MRQKVVHVCVKFFRYILSSVDTHSTGASARKLTAFVMVDLIIVLEVATLWYGFKHWEDALLAETVKAFVIYDMVFAGLNLGLTTVETLISLTKNKNNEKPNPTTENA
jgi:hypothetical protein